MKKKPLLRIIGVALAFLGWILVEIAITPWPFIHPIYHAFGQYALIGLAAALFISSMPLIFLPYVFTSSEQNKKTPPHKKRRWAFLDVD